MSDTPETDAAEIVHSPLEGDVWVQADLARKLEMERNQLLESLKNTSKGTDRLSKSNQFLMGELIQCRKERDDLQKRLDDLSR
jgi:hypothetical protein